MIMTYLRYCLFLLILWIASMPGPASAATSAVLLSDDQGNILFASNKTRKMVPASILKVYTSLVALKTFGPEYRPETWALYNPVTQDLNIKGFGNPLFISEEIQTLCNAIKSEFAPDVIRHIILDHSFFSPDIHIPGTGHSLNPYDATTGALCANFNTVSFKWSNTINQYVSAEPQTPLLNRFQDQIKATGLTRGRILLRPTQRNTYTGFLARAFFRNTGVAVTGSVIPGSFIDPEGHKHVSYSGFTLAETVARLLRYSNNYIANQLMLMLGATAYGPPATLDKGMTYLKAYAEKTLEISDLQLVEASGLSRQNKISTEQMLKVLKAFMPYHGLMRRKGNEYYKTGTLSDVKTRTGYLKGKDTRLYPYVIILNDTKTGYEKILAHLKQQVRAVSAGQPLL